MKKITVSATILLLSLISTSAYAGYVKGHYRKNGTYVRGHYRSSPNNNKFDNYSTRGNINPYTGKRGTVDPYKSEW